MQKGMFLLVLLLLGLPQILMAADETNDTALNEFRLDQVTVYGDDIMERFRESATNTIVIDEETINSTPFDTLSDLLQQQGLGVIKASNADSMDFVTLRGYRSDHLGKELDGRMLFLINGRRTSSGAPNAIPVMNIERIEILRGPDMIPYSAAHSGGVINIVTKRATAFKPFSMKLEGGIGSDGYYKGSLLTNGMVDNFDFSLGYQYLTKNNYHDNRGDKVYNTKDDGANTVLGMLGYTFLDTHRIAASFYMYDISKAEKSSYIDDFGNLEEPRSTDRRNISMDVMYDGATRDNSWNWNAAYTYAENTSKSYSTNAGAGTNPRDYAPMGSWYKMHSGQASVTHRAGIFEVTGGGQFYIYDADISAATSAIGRHNSSTTFNYAGFLLGKVRLFDDSLIFTGGTRYDWYRVRDDWRNNRTANNWGKKNTEFDGLSPSIGVAYLPIDWLKLRADYTRGFRAPSGRELIEDTGYNYFGNPDLKAERSNTYETGFDLMFDWTTFSFTYFYSEAKNYIYQHSVPNVTPAPQNRVQNSDKQVREGIELQFSADVAKFAGWDDYEIRPYFNYNHLFRLEEKFRSGMNWNDLAWVPFTSMSGGLRFRYKPADLMVNINYTCIGKAYSNVTTNRNTGVTTAKTNQGNFDLVNISLQKRLWDFEGYGQLNLKANVYNLFNESYVAFRDTVKMPGRTFYLGIEYCF